MRTLQLALAICGLMTLVSCNSEPEPWPKDSELDYTYLGTTVSQEIKHELLTSHTVIKTTRGQINIGPRAFNPFIKDVPIWVATDGDMQYIKWTVGGETRSRRYTLASIR